MSGIDPETLKRHDFSKIGGTFNVFDMTFDVNDIWSTSARGCPCCLMGDIKLGTGRMEARPRLRFGWMLRTLGRCAVHGVPLIVIGPEYDKFSMGDFNGVLAENRDVWMLDRHPQLDCQNDGDDRSGVSSGRPSDVYFQGRIATTVSDSDVNVRSGDQIRICTAETAALPEGDGLQMLDDMPVHTGLLLTEVVGGMELFGDRYRRSEATEEERQAAVVAGFEFTGRGYVGLSHFLEKRDEKLWQVQRRGSFRQLYGTLQELLASRIGTAGYEKVTRFVAEHAYAHHALGPDDTFLGFSLPRRLHSIRTAEITHGIHRITLRRMLKSVGLLPPGAGKLGDSRVVVEAGTLDQLIESWHERLPTEEAKARLGISGPALEAIVRSGVLLEDSDPNRQNKVSRQSFEELISFLEKLPLGAPGPGMKRLTDMAKMGRRTYGDIIGLIINGTVKNVTRNALRDEPLRFDSIFVDPLEVKAASPVLSRPGLTLQLAKRQLGTTGKAIQQLVVSGHLESVTAKSSLTDRCQVFIVPSSLDEFQANHISLFDYSKGRGQIAEVKKWLAAAGIMPVFEKPGVATFYRKDSLAMT